MNQAHDAMLDIKLVSISQHAYAFTPKRTRFLKQVENGSEKALSFTATRGSQGKPAILRALMLLRTAVLA